MTSDLDIYRSAQVLIRQHGKDDAAAKADEAAKASAVPGIRMFPHSPHPWAPGADFLVVDQPGDFAGRKVTLGAHGHLPDFGFISLGSYYMMGASFIRACRLHRRRQCGPPTSQATDRATKLTFPQVIRPAA